MTQGLPYRRLTPPPELAAEALGVGEFQGDGSILRGLLWSCVPLIPFWYGIYRAVELAR